MARAALQLGAPLFAPLLQRFVADHALLEREMGLVLQQMGQAH